MNSFYYEMFALLRLTIVHILPVLIGGLYLARIHTHIYLYIYIFIYMQL